MPPTAYPLQPEVAVQVDRFLTKTDFAAFYRAYSWKGDTYVEGFPDILRLEKQLGSSGRQDGITLQDIQDVVAWGHLRNPRVSGRAVPLKRSDLYDAQGRAQAAMADGAMEPLYALQRSTKGLGPTYLSKVLRFAIAEHYGAIDSRCVRVFGQGDPSAKQRDWLTLTAHNYGSGWSISKTQRAWPGDYALWLTILRYMASKMPVPCPHPRIFVEEGLREKGRWACADVEMAIFAYASSFVQAESSRRGVAGCKQSRRW